jgi:hypothetical protein
LFLPLKITGLSMDASSFRGDCGRCAGLCCLALAFDRGPAFGFDKVAGEACRHLDADCRCTIHAERAVRGFSGCTTYDCLGAGQLATALFSGLSWRDSEAVRRQAMRAFALLVDIQRLRLALRALQRRDLLAPLEPTGGWTLAALFTTGVTATSEARALVALQARSSTT